MKDTLYTDDIYMQKESELRKFAFNEDVAHVFDDMVTRSVPGYEIAQSLAEKLSTKVLRDNDLVYDLGCSTATTLIRLAHATTRNVSYVGVDSSASMLKRAKNKIQSHELSLKIQLIQARLQDIDFPQIAFCSCLYTLQFLHIDQRLEVLSKLSNALRKDGIFLLAEKIKFSSEILQDMLTDEYYQFKESNGYSKLEIQRKRAALENVMTPLTLQQNLDLLKNAGFSSAEVCYLNLSFAIIVAKK